MVSSDFLLLLAAIVSFYFFFQYLGPKIDPREPPLITAKIPFIGHILGLIRYGVPYYVRTSSNSKHTLPAFTLDLLFTKIYIINSASLVSAVQRNHKTVSFDPFLTAAANRMAGIDGEGLKLLQETENGGGGVNNKVLHSMHPALLGPGLDRMNSTMINNLQISIDKLELQHNLSFDLHTWCRHAITVASTDAVYGPLNPFKSGEIETAFWTYESNLSILLLNVLPNITARKAFKAREKIVASFLKFYEAGGQENSSELTYGRWKAQDSAGASNEDIARLETAASIGILSNTVPSAFWTLFEIYSRPELLAKLREEIASNALRVGSSINGTNHTRVIDLAAIKTHCPLFLSTFQEVLRLRSNGAPTRVVSKDIVLNGQYLLKAGSVLQMPSQLINRESSTWGENAEEFSPSRFITNDQAKEHRRTTGFMSFGASPNICPGRHFATGEIMALIGMMVLRYNITPLNGSWDRPKLNPRALAASVTPPIEEFRVSISPRKGIDGASWSFCVTEGENKFGLITG